MKKRLLSYLLMVALIVGTLPMVAFAAEAPQNNVTLLVNKNGEAGLDGDIKINFTKSNDDYYGTLYLPGGVDTGKLKLSWNEGIAVSVEGKACASGEADVPANGKSITYTITSGDVTANYIVKTTRGSVGVKGMFLIIDESKGTIEAMNSDPNHETSCYGEFVLNGKAHYLSMKGRGNWTWTNCTKKPYNITVYKDDTYDKKDSVKLFGDTKSKKWSILANELDPSYLRNKIGYDIAQELGIGLPSESIDVWTNGEYLGNYLLTPKNDYQSPSDGYMVEIDNKNDADQFTLPSSPLFTVKDKSDALTVDDVKQSVSKAWDALRKTDSDEYLEYFDLDSWAKLYLLNELYKDIDVNAGSIFFTKNSLDDSDKLVAGPVWDLDQTLGRTNSTYISLDTKNENSADGWYIDGITTYPTPFFQLLGKHESFMKRVGEVYNENKNALSGILADMDTQSTLIADSAKMDFSFWNRALSGSYVVDQDIQTFGTGSYAVTYHKTDCWEAYVSNMKEYVTKRLAFFSDNLTVTVPAGKITGTTTLADNDTLTLTTSTKASSYQWQYSADGVSWKNISGADKDTYISVVTSDMNGAYYRCVLTNIKVIDNVRVADITLSSSAELDPVQISVSGSHVHDFVRENTDGKYLKSAADCDNPAVYYKSCVCGASAAASAPELTFTSGSPLGHNWGNAEYKWDNNICTRIKTCTRNTSHSDQKTETGKYVKDTDATCSSAEKGHYEATFTDTNVTVKTANNSVTNGSPLSHNYGNLIPEKAATCTEDGMMDHYECSSCHKLFNNNKEETTEAALKITKLGHELVHHDAKAPTETEIGWDAYDTCSRCDYSTYIELPPLSHVHDLVHHNAKAVTCTEIGWEAYDTCKSCSYTTYKEIPALGHDYQYYKKAAGNCVDGYECGKCVHCGAEFNKKIINGYSTCYVKSFKLSKGKKCFTAKWKKQSKKNQKKFSGYQIRYSTNSSMAGCKYATAKKSASSKKISKLKKKTKYYVQVRSYRKVNGKNYYSSWSSKKSVKTK